jgi:hypothetical protein
VKFWRIFEEDLGPIGQRPELFWTPRLAEVCHIRPGDIGVMTPTQLHGAFLYSDPE